MKYETVTVYHNSYRDPENPTGHVHWDGYHAEYNRMTPVFVYAANLAQNGDVVSYDAAKGEAEHAFTVFNGVVSNDTDRVIRDRYYASWNRSLSVGDVVQVGKHLWFAVDRVGFRLIDAATMKVGPEQD